MKKVTLAIAATLALASAVPATAGAIDPFSNPVVEAPVVTAGGGISPLAIIGGLILVGVVAAGDS